MSYWNSSYFQRGKRPGDIIINTSKKEGLNKNSDNIVHENDFDRVHIQNLVKNVLLYQIRTSC